MLGLAGASDLACMLGRVLLRLVLRILRGVVVVGNDPRVRILGARGQFHGCSFGLGVLGKARSVDLIATLKILSSMLVPISEDHALSQLAYLRVRGLEWHHRAAVSARHRAGAEWEDDLLVGERHLGACGFRVCRVCAICWCVFGGEGERSLKIWVATSMKLRQSLSE